MVELLLIMAGDRKETKSAISSFLVVSSTGLGGASEKGMASGRSICSSICSAASSGLLSYTMVSNNFIIRPFKVNTWLLLFSLYCGYVECTKGNF